jgi:pyridoxal phosphate enzyme (YggS family)
MLILPQNSPEFAHTAADLARRIVAVRGAVEQATRASGRSVDSVTLLAVSKGHGADVVRQAAALGLAQFGENYAAEALVKIQALADLPLTWHFIGRLQANKTRDIARHFHWVHGVDRLKIAQRLSAQREQSAPLDVCVQVNVLAEERKAGVAPARLGELLHAVAELPNLRLRGLMCMLPFELTEAAERRAAFERMRELLCGHAGRLPQFDTLSMGMSADYVPAIAAGATIVRIGTALFGPRPAAVE